MAFLKDLALKVQSMSWVISMPDRVELIRHIIFMNIKYIFIKH